LYSEEFAPAVPLLQWQTVGNIFKLGYWALGFSFVAAARSGTFLFTQINFNALFLGILVLGFPLLGFNTAGVGYLVAHVLHFGVILFLAHKLQGFHWEPLSSRLLYLYVLLSVVLLAVSLNFPLIGALTGTFLGLAAALIGGRIVISKIGHYGRLVSRVVLIYELIGWPIKGMK
jgi:PST family polysaccharide transporter